ncbi:MAG TPA: hypothetical protein DD733_00870, partial [Clostridiales bacterium]|nr:hypothetical protein [Clostridiales bacterium]
GDVNGDGKVSSIDYLLVKRAFLGTYKLGAVNAEAADVNNNGLADSADYLRIKRHFYGTYDIYE